MILPSADQRLSRITTLWTLVQRAHQGGSEAVTQAQRLLMERYCGAVYRYLVGALRDEEAAADLFQEFALGFLRGDFHRADPSRGRFRDYLRKALINLVNDYRQAQRGAPVPLSADLPAPADPGLSPQDDPEFMVAWRGELMDHAWDSLKDRYRLLHTVLLLHVQHPEMPSAEVAREISRQFDKRCTADSARVTLHRAREKFLDFLVDEVACSLESCSTESLVQELRELQLFKLCSPALRRRGVPVETN